MHTNDFIVHQYGAFSQFAAPIHTVLTIANLCAILAPRRGGAELLVRILPGVLAFQGNGTSG
jgi:hypothetical protein